MSTLRDKFLRIYFIFSFLFVLIILFYIIIMLIEEYHLEKEKIIKSADFILFQKIGFGKEDLVLIKPEIKAFIIKKKDDETVYSYIDTINFNKSYPLSTYTFRIDIFEGEYTIYASYYLLAVFQRIIPKILYSTFYFSIFSLFFFLFVRKLTFNFSKDLTRITKESFDKSISLSSKLYEYTGNILELKIIVDSFNKLYNQIIKKTAELNKAFTELQSFNLALKDLHFLFSDRTKSYVVIVNYYKDILFCDDNFKKDFAEYIFDNKFNEELFFNDKDIIERKIENNNWVVIKKFKDKYIKWTFSDSYTSKCFIGIDCTLEIQFYITKKERDSFNLLFTRREYNLTKEIFYERLTNIIIRKMISLLFNTNSREINNKEDEYDVLENIYIVVYKKVAESFDPIFTLGKTIELVQNNSFLKRLFYYDDVHFIKNYDKKYNKKSKYKYLLTLSSSKHNYLLLFFANSSSLLEFSKHEYIFITNLFKELVSYRKLCVRFDTHTNFVSFISTVFNNFNNIFFGAIFDNKTKSNLPSEYLKVFKSQEDNPSPDIVLYENFKRFYIFKSEILNSIIVDDFYLRLSVLLLKTMNKLGYSGPIIVNSLDNIIISIDENYLKDINIKKSIPQLLYSNFNDIFIQTNDNTKSIYMYYDILEGTFVQYKLIFFDVFDNYRLVYLKRLDKTEDILSNSFNLFIELPIPIALYDTTYSKFLLLSNEFQNILKNNTELREQIKTCCSSFKNTTIYYNNFEINIVSSNLLYFDDKKPPNYFWVYILDMDYLSQHVAMIKESSLLKQLKESNQALYNTIRSIIHDINKPLDSISNLIKLGNCSPELFISFIENIKSILRSSRKLSLETSKGIEIQKSADYAPILQTIFNQIKSLYPDLKFKYYFPSNFIIENSDIDLLTNVFSNLLFNSAKFNQDSNNLKIVVNYFISKKDNKKYYFVLDNGIGVPQEHQNTIFELNKTAGNKYSGTGTGLYIVKTIITKHHNGNIILKSKPNKFTKFYFTIG